VQDVGLDVQAFEQCVNSGAYQAAVQRDYDHAEHRAVELCVPRRDVRLARRPNGYHCDQACTDGLISTPKLARDA
jgi:hypothetical protein